MGKKRGVIFSIDSFVAFTLIVIAIYGLFAIIGTPKSYFSSLEQAADLSHDSLLSLSRLQTPTGETYLGLVARTRGISELPFEVREIADAAIPSQFGYTFEVYNPEAVGWVKVPNSRSNHTDVKYSRISASASAPVTFYNPSPVRGESPWCYKTCRGYYGEDANSNPQYHGLDADGSEKFCAITPCTAPQSLFTPGLLYISQVRLTVFI